MKKVSYFLTVILALSMNAGAIAQNPHDGCESLDLNSITYIEDENEFDLGFDTADYLPLNFDPYQTYVDLEAVRFIEEEVVVDFTAYLPHDFDPYAYPTYFRTIDYVDPTDEIMLDFDTAENLPEGFDPYIRNFDVNIVSL